VDKIKNDVECARQNERKEEAETSQVGVSLGAVGINCYINIAALRRESKKGIEGRNELEFSCCYPNVCSDILDDPLLVLFGEVRFGGYAEHALERISE